MPSVCTFYVNRRTYERPLQPRSSRPRREILRLNMKYIGVDPSKAKEFFPLNASTVSPLEKKLRGSMFEIVNRPIINFVISK